MSKASNYSTQVFVKKKPGFYEKYIKRCLDFFLAFCALAVLSPILLILAMIGTIAMHGNPFFTQERPGKNEKIFKLIKFRTMTNKKDKNGKLLPDEKRLTSYGKFLRKTSLDELPQLWNVLVGDMSLVGPRPIVRDEIVKYGDYINDFYLVPPGITGVWQVSGRSDTTYEERVLMDSWYVHNWSVWIDIVYLLKTVLAVAKSKGAY